MQISQVTNVEEVAIARSLMREYQRELGVDLCFQGFAAELDGLPGKYAPPHGRLLLAIHDGEAIGCAALQPVNDSRAEMKRLYVRPSARSHGAGSALINRVIDEAGAIGYDEIVLDTLPTMLEAQRLYARFGFHEIGAYRPNPVEGTSYLGKRLR